MRAVIAGHPAGALPSPRTWAFNTRSASCRTPSCKHTPARPRSATFPKWRGHRAELHLGSRRMAVAMALIPGFARADRVRAARQFLGRRERRAVLYILLPLSLPAALMPARKAFSADVPRLPAHHYLEGAKQTIALGGRLAGVDQTAQLERRRLLQRQTPRIRSRTLRQP